MSNGELDRWDVTVCCAGMRKARFEVPSSTFRVADNGVLYVVCGMAQTEQGLGFLDQAVRFCPFCGRNYRHVSPSVGLQVFEGTVFRAHRIANRYPARERSR